MACICAIVSSNWNNGANAGTFNWNLNNASSNSNRNISTHLLCGVFKFKTHFDKMRALPLGKTHNNEQCRVSRFSKKEWNARQLLHKLTRTS
jgi:hypothetical protein